MILTHVQELRLIEEVLNAERVASDPARVQAHWLAEADLRGHSSHGIQRLPTIVGRIRRGLIDPNADPLVSWIGAAAATVDGRRGLGPWVGTRALDEVSDRALETGIAFAAVHNANHLGMLAPYLERAVARSGLLAIALTTSEALVHPWNGTKPMLGTNPIGVGIPTDPPVILDMATSAVSMGRILSHRHRGEPLEPGWAIDEHGHSTLDPHRAWAISPFGGPKGYGLALAIELLVGVLTGSALGDEVAGTLDADSVCNKGDVFVAISPAKVGVDSAATLARYIDALRGTPSVDGTQTVAIPGDGARRRRRSGLEHGIEIPDGVWREIVELCPVVEGAG